jgi:arginase
MSRSFAVKVTDAVKSATWADGHALRVLHIPALLVVCAMTAAMGQERGVSVALLKMPYVGERNTAELSPGPDRLVAGGLAASLDSIGARVRPVAAAKLSAGQEKEYGAWNRLALANGQLADLVSASIREGDLAVGLLANCSSLLGMLGGVQRSGPGSRPLRVGLVYLDAHADFNTPETTLSGMLGGMDVAAAAGLCLTNLRRTSKLEVPLPPRHIILGGVRDTDPLEQDLIDRSELVSMPVEDIRSRNAPFRQALSTLSQRVERLYIHVDMDVLDPREVPGHSLGVPGGPTSRELGAAITEMFKDPKAVAFGVASTPTGERDRDGVSLKAAYELIRAAVAGVQQRQPR